MGKFNNEFKVGLVVIVSILTLGAIIYRLGGFAFTKEGYEINVLFNYAAGVAKNAPVRLAGVEIGKVNSIELYFNDDTKVQMGLWLDKSTRVRADSKAYISSLGLMGEKYIEINPGSKDAPFLEADSTIVGEDPLQMDLFAKKGIDIAENLNVAIKDIQKLTNNVNDMVLENREQIDEIMVNVNATTENLKVLSEDIKRHPWKVITKPPGWKKMMSEE